MKTEGNQGAENFFAGGLGYVRAILAPRFKSIDQIKDASSRLVDNATSKAEFDRLDNLHKSLIEEIKPYYKYVADWFNEATAFGEEIKDLVKNGHSESFNQIPNELQAKIKQFAEDVVALPTDYFEAKPERGVMLSEFTAAVVPENTDSRVISILENNGLKVHKYGDNNRMEVVDRVSKDNNVLFQIASPLAINDKFNEDLSRMISGNLKIGHIFELGNPNHILKSAGLPDLPIQLNSSRLRAKSKQEEHPFDLSEIADLPLAIQNPLAVFRSATDIGSYVIFTDIPHKGENFIAAIEVNRVARNIAINSIRSVHYKKNNSILNWLDAELHNYLDKKRMIEWLNKQRSNSADVRQSFNHYANIINTFKNPSIYPENNNLFRILGETGASRLENAETVLNDLKVAREMENGGQHLSDAADFFFSQIPEELKVEARKYNRTEDAEAMKKIQANPKAKAAWANYIRAHEHLKEWQSLGEQEQKKRIRLATGWERGADGKWRYEVADNINIDKSVFNSLRSGETYNTVKLPELIGQDNDLFTTYPRLREVDVARNNINGAAVYSSGGNGQITINDKLTSLSAKSPLIHEIQHAIQAIEGFARGGNVDEFKRKYAELNERVDDYNKKLSKASSKGDKELYAQLMSDKMDAVKEILSLQDEYGVIGIKPYNNLAGEVEARNTETREGFTPEQRRETLLSETEDVAREEQIVLRQVLGEQSRTSPITETILELLEKAGIEVVIEKEAYNKAKKELLKANGVELKDGKGKVYGFAYQEKIYLDPDLVNPNTPIHEYTHLWDMALMKMDLELWDKGINLLKQTPEWNRVVNDPNYANIRHSDDLIASEVHARLVGKDGPAILQEMIDNAKAESPVSHMEALSVVDRIKRWLKQVYVKLFGNKVKNSGDLTLEQWISMPIKDLFEGKRITGEYLEKSPENVKFTDKTEQHGSEGQQREQGTEVPRTPRLGSEQERSDETRQILDELRHDVRGEGQDSGGTTATDNEAEGGERRKLQALATAEVRAKETGAWIGRNELSEIIDDGYRFTSGQESEVYLSKDRKSVIKLNNLSITSSIDSFLFRIDEHNKKFPETTYKIIGFSENAEGEFCIVLKQPFIGNTKEASRQQIDDYFRDKGWYKIIDGEYTDGYVEMWDVYPKNVLTDEAGNLYFIDVNIDPARERYQKYKLPDIPQMEVRPAKEFVKDGVFDVNGYLNSLPERPNVPVDILQSKSEKVVEHLQDRGLSLKKLQDLVKEKGNFDPKNMDAYMRENLSHGMAKNAIDTFDKTEKTALLKAMNAPTPADTQQAAPAEKVQQEAPETGTEEVDQPTTPQEQQQAAPVEQTQPQEQEQEQQKVEYPKDKEGNIDYNQITETGTYAEALEQEFGETSVSIVDEFIKNINEDIEKAGKGKDPIKKAREIKKLNDRLAFLDGVRNIIAPVREQELTDKARETTEQLEQVQERPPVQEAQVETVVPETKAADTARPINTRSKRKGWPMSKADQERLIKEPQSFEEAVLQFFLGGGRMSMDDYYTHFGKSREEMRKNIWMYSKKGQRLDALNENSIFASYPHLLRGLDGPMDMENAVFEVIRSHSGKNSIRERLDEIQNKPLEPEVPEDIQAEQNTDFEVENSEITGNDVIDEQLLSIFEEYYDNGEIDFSRLSEDLENDVGWFTVFPYNLSEQETNELKNILENADKRTKITDRVRNIVEPESGSQRDDTRDRTEEVERGDSGDRIPRVAETEATGTTPDTRAVESETLTEQESDKLKTGEQTELLFPDQEAIPQEPRETDNKDVAQFQIVQEENPLVVLHNTTEDKLIKSNRAGGLAMPSIAITKPNIGLSGFGDITLIGSKEVIDPQRTGTNKVYGADAYTPRYPNVVYTIGDKNALNNALKDIKDESIKNDIISGIENHIEREGDSYFDENKSVQLAFALNKGADVIVMRKTDLPREVIDFAEKTEGYDYLSIQGNEKAKTELNNVLLNSLDNKTKTLFERTGALKDGQISEKTLRNYFNEAKNWIRARGKVDFYGSEQNARDYIQKNNLQNEVKRFARDLYEQLNVNEKIFRGYTRTGNRRYAPHTVENAVREMKTEGNRGAENFFAGSLGYVRAMLAPRFKTIAQIKDASSRLVDNATSKAEFDRLDNLHKSLIEEIKPYYKYVADWFNEATAFGEEIKDLIKNGHSESFNQIPNELQAKIKQFAEDVVALPTDYFEAKPERGVMLSEFTAAVVPENTDSRVISILENNGLKVHKYGDNNRMEVVDRVSKDNNVLFQIASPLAINDKFNEDLSRMISGNLKIGHIFELGNPNHILKSAGLPDLPIQLNSSRLRAKSKQEEHPFDLSEIADLPLAIQNPLAVFRSATDIGSYVIFTDIPHKGENFIAAIEVNRVARNIAINSIRSVHYKKNNSILNWLDAELHNYLDKKRMIEWLNKQRSNSADVRQSFNHYANIINTFKNPSIYPENNNLFRILGETGASRLENAETVLNDLKVAREMENGGQHLSDAADFFFSQIPEELKVEARKYNRTEDAEAMKKIQANPKAKAAWANYIRAHEHLKEWQSLGEQEQKKRIRLATGWERGADGKWRYEVADNINIDKSVFNSLRSGETYNTVKLPELIGQDNDLFTTYPRLREVDVARNNINGAAVYSSGGNGQITINDKLTSLSAKSPLIHEIQHAIQAIEGFARGGNVDEFKRKYAELNERVDDYNKKLSKASSKGDKELYAQLMSDKMDAVKEILSLQDEYGVIGIKPYNNLAGEVEARNTETREGFTPEQRRETLLSETEDVAREEQIVLRQVLGEQSRTSPITETILELLEKAGIEVVMEKEAYNKAKEELLKANGVELKDGKGKVYGFAYQEKIYLDPDLVNPNTPIHEYTHLWDMALMKMDLELWDKGINLLKQTPEWNRVVNDPNYANIRHSDDLIASEVHARLVGKDGPTILQEMIDNAKAESPVSHMEALSVVDRIKRWLKQVYVKLFGNKVKNSGDLTLEQWISMPIKDLFEGKRITGEYLEKSPENVKFTDKTEQHGSEGQQREQGTDAIRAPRLGSEPGSVRETHRILDELRHDVRGEGQDSGGTTATDNEAEGSERRKLQALATAEVRAKETGAWIGRNELSEIIDDGYRFTSGQESEVYLSKDRKSVIKLNNLSIISSVESFLYRIENFNKYFPKTKYEIIGFSENSEGEFCFVLKQPFIGNTKEASRQQIDDYFRDKGWYKIIDGEYTDGYVEMWDVYPKNVLTDEAGNLYFIDVNIDPARERYQKYKLPDVPQMEIRPAKEFVKGGVFDVNGYLNSLPERPNVPVDMLQSKSEKVVEHLQDRGLSLKKLQDLVKEKGNFDPKNMDAYMRENLSHGMAKNAIDTFDKTEKTALLKAMNATGLNYKEINDYLKAKHIPERNAYYKEKSGREISGGLSTEEAIRRAEGYESKIKETLGAEEGTKAINDLWKAVTDITDYTLKKWLEYGYLDREGYDRMKAMYDNYVPLRGFAASEIDQMIDYQEGQMGLGKNVNPLKKAKGRTTEADDPVQYMINMAYSSVVMGEKNRVKQTLARMVRGNPEMEDIFRFQRVYEVWDGTVDEDGNRNYTEVLERPAQELFNNGW
jgi:uncharacterized protein YfkK (UPF0435 family)